MDLLISILIFPAMKITMKISLYPHQEKAIKELDSGSILCGGVGSGKSRTAIAYYFCKECGGKLDKYYTLGSMTKPKDLYIITTAKKRDNLEWDQECAYFGLSKDRDLSWTHTQVFIDSWNNIAKYQEVENAFFIFDEQRLVGSGKWVKAFLKIAQHNRWVLLSATPGDTWSDYIPVFVANGFYKNRTAFLKRHAVYNRFTKYPKIDRYVDCKRLEDFRKRITVDMPYPRKTIRHIKDEILEHDEILLSRIFKDRWNPYDNKPIKDISEVCYLMRRVVNSDPSRIAKVKELVKEHPKTIIFYNFDYELELLRKFCKEENISYGEWNGHKHESIPDTDRWVYLVQYTAGAEGWNCIKTNVVIFYSLNYSYKIMEQASGRIDRMNTPFIDLYYYRLRSNSSIDNGIFRSLTKKKKFNEWLFINE